MADKISDALRDCKNVDELNGSLLALALSDNDRNAAERASVMLIQKAVRGGAKLSDDLDLKAAAKAASDFLRKRH